MKEKGDFSEKWLFFVKKGLKYLPLWQKAWQADLPWPSPRLMAWFKSSIAFGMFDPKRWIWALLLKHEALFGVKAIAFDIKVRAASKFPFSASWMASNSNFLEFLQKTKMSEWDFFSSFNSSFYFIAKSSICWRNSLLQIAVLILFSTIWER